MTGTSEVNNKYYYFDPNQSGAMLKGWYKNSKGDNAISTKTGKCGTGLRPINSEYYYFDAKTGWAQKVPDK